MSKLEKNGIINKEVFMSITKEFLPKHENITVYQDDEVFRINTDTMALGEFLYIYKKDTVLDIGTNTGALLLYASMFNPKHMIGIDINEKALELAKRNMEENKIENVTLKCADATTYKGEEVDVIICNPPYFNTNKKLLSKDEYKNLAKHEGVLNLENLIKAIRRNLKNHGTLFLLFQTSRLTEVIEELKKNKMTVKKLKFVHDVNKEYSNVVLIKAVKGAKSGIFVEKPLIISR